MKFRTERVSVKENFPYPDENAVVFETLPTFIWLKQENAKKYTLRIFLNQKEIVFMETSETFVNLTTPLSAGKYTYTVETDNGKKTDPIAFSIAEDAVTFVRPTATELLDSVPAVHPRHLFYAQDIPSLRKTHEADLDTLRKNIQLAYQDGMPTAPLFATPELIVDDTSEMSKLPYREYFGRYRDFCDRDMIACGLAYELLQDKQAGEHGKKILLTICTFNPTGACSLLGQYGGDEIGLSNARCLPAALDLFWDLLTDRERRLVAENVALYAEQCFTRINGIQFKENPSESHVGRLPAYLGEAALALKGTGVRSDETLLSWLQCALEIYGGIFPFYGTPDGAWAEGAFYATSYTKWYLPFFSAVLRFTGKDFLIRPFYRHFCKYLTHFASPQNEIHPFGDGYWCHSEDAEWPGFFAQNPFRVYADRFGDAFSKKLATSCSAANGFHLHLLDIFLPCVGKQEDTIGQQENVAAFPYGGFVSMHSCLGEPGDVSVLMRASRFGSDSHRHPDQGSFSIFADGVCLISPSGYFGREYGSTHHRLWTNSSAAHNVILVDGIGQPSGAVSCTGKIVQVEATEKKAVLNLSAAYANSLTGWIRTITLKDKTVWVEDKITADKPVSIQYLLHSLSEPIQCGQDVRIERKEKSLRIVPMGKELGCPQITDKFEVDLNADVPPAYQVTMPKQYHITYSTQPAKEHHFLVKYIIE